MLYFFKLAAPVPLALSCPGMVPARPNVIPAPAEIQVKKKKFPGLFFSGLSSGFSFLSASHAIIGRCFHFSFSY